MFYSTWRPVFTQLFHMPHLHVVAAMWRQVSSAAADVVLDAIGRARMSHVTRHTSHVTRHTSHVTRHTSQVQDLKPDLSSWLQSNILSSLTEDGFAQVALMLAKQNPKPLMFPPQLLCTPSDYGDQAELRNAAKIAELLVSLVHPPPPLAASTAVF